MLSYLAIYLSNYLLLINTNLIISKRGRIAATQFNRHVKLNETYIINYNK
jgi:hypothetical protein